MLQRRCASLMLGLTTFLLSFSLVVVMWILLMGASPTARQMQIAFASFDDAEFAMLGAAAQAGLFLVLVPVQLALLDWAGVDWRVALNCYKGNTGSVGNGAPPPRSSTPTLQLQACGGDAAGHVVSVSTALSAWITPLVLAFALTTVLYADMMPIVSLTENSVTEELLLPVLLLIAVLFVVCPYPLLRPERAWFFSAFGSSLACLCGWSWLPATFETTFVANALTSSSLILWNLESSICFYIRASPFAAMELLYSGANHTIDIDPNAEVTLDAVCAGETWNQRVLKPIVAALPYLIRFVQCYSSFLRAAYGELTNQLRSYDGRRRSARDVLDDMSGSGDDAAFDELGFKVLAAPRERGRCGHFCAWRVAKNGVNSLKYGTGLLVIVVASLKNENARDVPFYASWWGWAWIGTVLLKTCFCACWDVVCDWAVVTVDWTHCYNDCACCSCLGGKRRGERGGEGTAASLGEDLLSDRDSLRERMFSRRPSDAESLDFGGPSSSAAATAIATAAPPLPAAGAAAALAAATGTEREEGGDGVKATLCAKDGRRPHLGCLTLRVYDRERSFLPLVYFIAAGFNLLARFAWAVVLGPYIVHGINAKMVLAAIEIVRRLFWGILRIENRTLALARKAKAEARLQSLTVASRREARGASEGAGAEREYGGAPAPLAQVAPAMTAPLPEVGSGFASLSSLRAELAHAEHDVL